MYESEESSGPSGAMDRLKRLLLFLVVAGLLAVAGYLQVERNHRTYFTATHDGALVISKGSYFLWGARPYVPDDPPSAEAYAPIPIPAGAPPVPDERFDEREDLDRFLFELLAGWAEPRIRTAEPERMKEGFLYVERATRLTGLSGTQSKKLRELRAEVAFFEARDRIEQASVLLEEAREKLRLASDGSAHAREAAVLLEQLEPANQVVSYALRTARLGVRAAEGVAPAYYPVAVPTAAANGPAAALVAPAPPAPPAPAPAAVTPALRVEPTPALPAPAPGAPPATVPPRIPAP
jgi:hypothetical protein